MSLYRMSSIFLVLSAGCLAAAVGLGSSFHVLVSWICMLLAGQLYGSAVKQEQGEPAGRR